MRKVANTKLRFNIITVVIYIIGIILLLQLFNLQIIHGKEYREKSNTRLTRESVLEAARGSILDGNGNTLASDTLGFKLELYKSKADNETLNNTILKIVNVLEQNGNTYVDSFPISINPFAFNLSTDEKIAKWKKDNKIDENATPEECFHFMKEKYKISNESVEEIRKILSLRYEITQKGYSSTKAITISENINIQTALIFNEQANEFPGINVIVQPLRNYPSSNLASHILGNIGRVAETDAEYKMENYQPDDIIGRTGIEYVFEKYLKGENGTKQIDMTVDGTVTEEYITKEAVKGSDIVLTIDANLQKVTEEALKDTIDKIRNGGFSQTSNANAGSAVVMNVNTGEVLAMASYPDFNPQDFVGGISTDNWNAYKNNEYHPLVNKAVQDAYSPGSIFKMITAIAGLQTGNITLREEINDTGIYTKYADSPKRCWYYTSYHRGHGRLNVSGAIEKSCNYFFYETGDRTGIDSIEKYARYFGLGEKTGVELSSETTGIIASKAAKEKATPDGQDKRWYPGDTLSAAIGQSYNQFSPLQIAKYISMFCNGGKKLDVSIVKSILRADGSEVARDEINQYVKEKLNLPEDTTEDLEINNEYLKAILEGMKSVTGDSGGTAYNMFKNFGIEVGGKTGSAEAGKNKDNTDKVNAWFTGFAPFDNPQIAVVVFIENGAHGNYCGETARTIIEQYFGMNTNQVQEDMTAKPYTETIR